MALLDFVSIAGAGTTATRDTTGATLILAMTAGISPTDFTLGGTVPAGIFAVFDTPASPVTEDTNHAQGDTSPLATGSGTSTQDFALFVAGIGGTTSTASVTGAGYFMVDDIAVNGGVNFSVSMGIVYLASAGNNNPGWVFTGGGSGQIQGAVIAVFQSAGGGGSTWPGYIAPFGWQ
jgi:hypothetical protein